MNNFWRNKKVLITGHTGFKGGWISLFLFLLGSKVYGISNEKKVGFYKLTDLQKIFEKEFFLDLSKVEVEKLCEVFEEINPDIVFHLAAQSIVSIGFDDPIKTVETNIVGTLKVCLALSKSKPKSTLIISTTDKVYKNSASQNLENYELDGSDFYSYSKVAVENLLELNSRNLLFDLNIGIVRSGNVLGGGDRGKDRLIVDILDSHQKNNILKIRNKNSIRPWQYILDSVYGYLLVAENIYRSEKFNIYNLNSKTNNFHTVEKLVTSFQKYFQNDFQIQYIKSNFYEKDVLTIDSSKARVELGWNTETTLDKIVLSVVNWENFHFQNKDVHSIKYSSNEIRKFIIENQINYFLH
ncbi:CDP-glucose 4,6-dehydratase [Acidimicrobiia bacterium]|nr:CDP-glucose 4,6-dehydratase [Acidimicrobiia bacterium]